MPLLISKGLRVMLDGAEFAAFFLRQMESKDLRFGLRFLQQTYETPPQPPNSPPLEPIPFYPQKRRRPRQRVQAAAVNCRCWKKCIALPRVPEHFTHAPKPRLLMASPVRPATLGDN